MSTGAAIRLRGRALVPGAGPFVFGVLNCTPDSFSDGGSYATHDAAVRAALLMAEAGADAIDVGGESTRPGSGGVPAREQIERTIPVICELARRFGPQGPAISIDTRSAEVAGAALSAGAMIVNDVSALRHDAAMAATVARHGAGVILMHMKGTPADMQLNPVYADVVAEVRAFLEERIVHATSAGIPRERIVADPGIGFGKTGRHNLEILRNLDALRALGVPLMVGTSRKRFIGDILSGRPPGERLYGTLATVAACVLAGVECVRVHDVEACRQAADVCAAIRTGELP